jgi:hypothetical protein
VLEDKDIARCAQLLVSCYGENAALRATSRADVMLEAGDPYGAAVWRRILKAVDELQASERPDGAPLH